ncbi:hypothetical protein ACEE23_04180 [Corynebacterium sp. 32222D000AT]|uniref:hypothetical protein n=1 Tax=unclassified Corynebacterium TaxID=2624378 RepID=UPI002A9BB529|nr:hypothetical protein [Mycobacteriaceae bacterium]MDY5829186.1 hypothetical protein [Corynebacterium sp.]
MAEFYFNHPFAETKLRVEAPAGSRYVVVSQRSDQDLEILDTFDDYDAARELVMRTLQDAANHIDEMGYGEDVKVTHMRLKPIPEFA